jgi:hypothetical protein
MGVHLDTAPESQALELPLPLLRRRRGRIVRGSVEMRPRQGESREEAKEAKVHCV